MCIVTPSMPSMPKPPPPPPPPPPPAKTAAVVKPAAKRRGGQRKRGSQGTSQLTVKRPTMGGSYSGSGVNLPT